MLIHLHVGIFLQHFSPRWQRSCWRSIADRHMGHRHLGVATAQHLVGLGGDVEGDAVRLGTQRQLVRAQLVDDAAVLDHALSPHEHHVDPAHSNSTVRLLHTSNSAYEHSADF